MTNQPAPHDCPAEACHRQVPRSKLACPEHWALVSRPTQQRVYKAYRESDFGAHVTAMGEAIQEMNR
jgi:hypothetical protein